MSKTLKTMWPEYNGPDAEITAMRADKERGSLELELFCERFNKDITRESSVFLKRSYPNLVTTVSCEYPKSEFSAEACYALIESLAETGVAINGFFDGAEIKTDGVAVTISLKHGGLKLLEGIAFEENFCALALETFGVSCSVRFEGETDAPEKALEYVAASVEELTRKPADKPKHPGARPLTPSEVKILARELSAPEYIPVIGRKPTISKLTPLSEAAYEPGRVTVFGEVFDITSRETRGGFTLCVVSISDGTGSLELKLFDKGENSKAALSLQKGDAVVASGDVAPDRYENELLMLPRDVIKVFLKERADDAEQKHIELHCHTNMSAMDALPSARAVVKRAAAFGHPAVAITDHGVVQSFPEAREALLEVRKSGNEAFKVIYGVECYYVDDTARALKGECAIPLDGEAVVFDLETTGLYAARDRITEIGAVRVKNGEIADTFSTFVDPEMPIPPENTKITGITDDMVAGAPKEPQAIAEFLKFAGDAPLIAHNASFDIGFLRAAAERAHAEYHNASLDTLPLARALLSELSKHRLDTLARHFKIAQQNHHRALDDAVTLAQIWFKLCGLLRERGADTFDDISTAASGGADKQRPFHMTLLVKNMKGLRNLYELITDSHLEHYANKRPRIPRSKLMKLREGLLIGSACEAGEVFSAIVDGRPDEEILELAEKYDYFEIMPLCNNAFLVREGAVEDESGLIELNRRVIDIAAKLGKPVVATGDVHFLDERDGIYRKILVSGLGYSDSDEQPPMYFRTTDEMLAEFVYLGEDMARKVVIDNPQAIADIIDPDIQPIPSDTYTPAIDGAEDTLRELAREGLRRLYGEHPHEDVIARMEKELNSIIGNGYAVLYVIAQKLVAHSEAGGYHVGSRGSVGSSFIATLIGITEVNPLPPHYICGKCKHFEFVEGAKAGYDLTDSVCPECGEVMKGEGQDIPFETFLGFHGEKQPDIDLNFSGEFQQEAHRYTEELFGKEHVFKAGTISALQEKKAYGYVKKYLEERGLRANRAESNRLALGCTGIKQTTGQHPGGMVVIPSSYSINDFTPAQHPADKTESDIITTHFDFNSLHDTLLKLDELGHDVPTIMHYLERLTGVNCADIPMNDPEVMKLFTSTEPLGLTEKDIDSKTGTFGLPEMGTATVRGILVSSQPQLFSDLVQVSGLSHGTDVWAGNAEELIKNGTCRLGDVIGTRDSIMLELMRYGLEPATAFEIMEITRKGRALSKFTDKHYEAFKQNKVPDWYVESCKKIKYMFPKAHAVAYIMSAIRLGWYKLYYPLEFYSTYFTVRGEDIDAEAAAGGLKAVRARLAEQKALARDARKTKDEDTQTALLMMCEMLARGYEFLPIDLYKSHATQYLIEDGRLRLPFVALKGVGEAAANALYEAAHNGREYLSAEELLSEPGVTRGLLDAIAALGGLGELPETSQMTFGELV